MSDRQDEGRKLNKKNPYMLFLKKIVFYSKSLLGSSLFRKPMVYLLSKEEKI